MIQLNKCLYILLVGQGVSCDLGTEIGTQACAQERESADGDGRVGHGVG